MKKLLNFTSILLLIMDIIIIVEVEPYLYR